MPVLSSVRTGARRLPSRDRAVSRSLAEARRRQRPIRRALLVWAPTAARPFPWRALSRTPYEVLIAELLLRRTTSTAANRVYHEFLREYPSFEAIVAAPPGELERALSTVGLQNQRARAARDIAEFVLERWRGKIPEDEEALLSIPHVGPYVARAVRSFAFGHPVAIVDSNVERIVRRLLRDSLPSKPSIGVVTKIAEALLSTKRHREYNLGLLDLGALVCRYVRPRCSECPLLKYCDAGNSAEPAP